MTNFINGNETVSELSQEASSLVAQYKNIIREQDHKIQTLNEQLKQLQLQNENMTVKLLSKIVILLCFLTFPLSFIQYRQN